MKKRIALLTLFLASLFTVTGSVSACEGGGGTYLGDVVIANQTFFMFECGGMVVLFHAYLT